jgi:uncharacterized protein
VELIEHGRMDNFLRLEGKSAAPQKGPVYSDSDIYKWMEAVGFALQSGPMPELCATTDEMIRQVVAAQEPGGYLNTYFVESKRGDRMLPKTQTGGHELYCIGHLLQGGIAFYRATGDPALLNAGMRYQATATCAAFIEESRMEFINATKPSRKSGVWGTRRFVTQREFSRRLSGAC